MRNADFPLRPALEVIIACGLAFGCTTPPKPRLAPGPNPPAVVASAPKRPAPPPPSAAASTVPIPVVEQAGFLSPILHGNGKHAAPCPPGLPRELNKVSLPDYVIEPPDILVINAVKLIPRPPYHIEPLDTLIVQAKGALPTDPLAGEFVVEPDGRVALGRSYGSVAVAGLTVDEARTVIEAQLKGLLADPSAYVAPARTRAPQQIVGEHLVRPDGKVSLGTYGFVRVAGMTALQAKAEIEAHLLQYLLNPEVSVDVVGFNSKVIYVIYDGGGPGQTVVRLPVTGSETVLDAISQMYGLSAVASKCRIWIARPAPAPATGVQKLSVDWVAITTEGRTDTNYQLFPGDRVYVGAKPLLAADFFLARLTAPFERLFGFTLLGSGVVSNLQQFPTRGSTTTTTTTR